MSRQYTMAEKLAYYKAKAGASHGRSAPSGRSYQPGTTRSMPGRTAGRQQGKKDWGFNWDGWGVKAGFNYKSGRNVAPMSRTTAPTAVSTHVKTSTPAIKAGVNKTFMIENRELLSSVIWNGDPTFQVTAYSINPGLPDIMPYASNVAKSYTRYKMELCLEYAPSVPSTVSGTIALAYDRNSQAPPPGSIQDVMSYEGSTVGSVWAATNFPANSARINSSEKKLYTRYGVLTNGEDINLYDMCKVFICLNGVAGDSIIANQSMGNVYINYKITFMNQKLSFVAASNVFSYNENFVSTSFVPGATNPAIPQASIFNYAYEYGQGGTQYLPGSLTQTGKNTLIFPLQGVYAVVYHAYCVVESGTLSGTVNVNGSAFISSFAAIGSDTIVSASVPDQQSVLVPSQGTLAFSSNSYIVEILNSGTYSSGGFVLGGGFLSWDNTTLVSTLNAHANIGTGVIKCIQSWLEVVQISQDEATFYDSLVFVPSPLTTSIAHSVHHRSMYRSVQSGTGHYGRRKQALLARPSSSSSNDICPIDPETCEGSCHDEDGLSILEQDIVREDAEYQEYLRWKKDNKKP